MSCILFGVLESVEVIRCDIDVCFVYCWGVLSLRGDIDVCFVYCWGCLIGIRGDIDVCFVYCWGVLSLRGDIVYVLYIVVVCFNRYGVI